MRIHTKTVFDANGNIMEDEWFEYQGPIAKCGGGGGDTETVQKADPWAGQQPYLSAGFQQAYDNLNSPPQYYQGSTVVPLSDQTQSALYLQQERALNGSPTSNAANDNMAATLRGDFLGSNPYLDAQYDQAAGAVKRNTGSQFASAGRTGSGLAADTLNSNLSGLASEMYGDAYDKERGRQMQSLALAPQYAQQDYMDIDRLLGVGQTLEGQNRAELQADIDRWNYNQNLPNASLNNYMQLVGGGNYGSVNTQIGGGPNKTTTALGGAASGAAMGGQYGGGWGALAGGLAGGLLGYYG